MNAHCIKLAEDEVKSLQGQLLYCNEMLEVEGNNLDRWEVREYSQVIEGLALDLDKAQSRLKNCIELAK